MHYLDNNSTTFMPQEVVSAMVRWCNRGNPSSSYAGESRKMMADFRATIARMCGVKCCSDDSEDAYRVIFTSGASEANCTAVESIIAAYNRVIARPGRRYDNGNPIFDRMTSSDFLSDSGYLNGGYVDSGRPHVIISAIEHKSLRDMVASYADRGIIDADVVSPVGGHIYARDIEPLIRDTTCLIIVMHANNETGAINNIAEIGELAHSRGIVFHCDTVQTFGKYKIDPVQANIDSFCISFHKLHGPPGVGALIIKQRLLSGYKIAPVIFGSQNEGLRGGTENLPGIGASFEALKYTMTNRAAKNTRVAALKSLLMGDLQAKYECCSYADYMRDPGPRFFPLVVFLSGILSDTQLSQDNHRRQLSIKQKNVDSRLLKDNSQPTPDLSRRDMEVSPIGNRMPDPRYLVNTVLLSVIIEDFCNAKLKQHLEKNGVIVSVGSACNTSSDKASHVLYAMGADKYIRQGTIRVSLCDTTTPADIKKFVAAFCKFVDSS